jgi:radical SAM protein with 4Fe4S-binding SPASM domain
MKRKDIGDMSELSLYSEAQTLRLGRAISPRMAIIHPTNRCNHACTGCEYANVHTSLPAEFQEDELLELVDDVADLGVFSVLFSGGGEPSLNRYFGAALERAYQRKLTCGIFSNGAGIDDALAKTIAATATFIRISVDASTPKTFASIRRVHLNSFGQTKANITKLIQAKAETGSEVEIGLKFLVRDSNVHEIISFVEFASELGVSNVQFKPLRNEPEEPSGTDLGRALGFITRAKSLYPDVKIGGGVSQSICVETPCWITPLRVVVSAEGDVHLCNYFNHRRDTHTIGNIKDTPLCDIWFSEAHKQALANIDNKQCGLYDCRFHQLNTELLSLAESHRSQLDLI